MNKLQIKILSADAVVPNRAHVDDAGYDLYSVQDVSIPANECRIVPTGVAIHMPPGTYGRIAPRSSLGVKNVIVNGGVIDRGYTAEIKVILSSIGKEYQVKKGDKVAQLILERHEILPTEIVDVIDFDTLRGQDGFGSTGK